MDELLEVSKKFLQKSRAFKRLKQTYCQTQRNYFSIVANVKDKGNEKYPKSIKIL